MKSAQIVEKIQERAIEKWGDNWMAQLVHAYIKIEGKQASFSSRRPQIGRVFEVGGCTLETAIRLAAAVGCEFQMSCTETRVIKF